MDLRRLRLDFQVIPAWGRGLIPCWIGAALGLHVGITTALARRARFPEVPEEAAAEADDERMG